MTTPTRAGWHDDPYERFEQRYHDGRRWTRKVSSAGVEITDPQAVPAAASAERSTPRSAPPSTAPAVPGPATATGPRPATAVTPASMIMTEQKRLQMAWLALACGAVLVLSTFLPWGTRGDGATLSGARAQFGYVSGACGIGILLYGRQALKPGLIRHHGWAIAAIVMSFLVALSVSSILDSVDEATFGAAEAGTGTGVYLVYAASLAAIWPIVVFRRDYRARGGALQAAMARYGSTPDAPPPPPGIPPAPR